MSLFQTFLMFSIATGEKEEHIDFQTAICIDGTQNDQNMAGLKVKFKEDLFPVKKESYNNHQSRSSNKKARFDWGATEKESDHIDYWRHKYYSRSVLLAIPSNHRFQSFLYSKSPTQCLQYLMNEIEAMSPQFKEYLETVLNKYTADAYEDWNTTNMNTLIELLLKVSDTELTMLFINKIMSERKYSSKVAGIRKETERLTSRLLQTVPWKDIKQMIDNIIERSEFQQYERWMEVYELSSITDIAHKIIELSLKKLSESKQSYVRGKSLWEKIFDSVCANQELSERWLDTLLNCQEITSSAELVSLFCSRLSPTNQVKVSILLNHFIQCLRGDKHLVEENNKRSHYSSNMTEFEDRYGHVKMITYAIQPLLDQSGPFEKELLELCDFLYSTGNSRIVGKVLFRFATNPESSLNKTKGFKIILNSYFDHLSTVKMNNSNSKEITKLAHTVLLSNASDIQSNTTNFVKLCDVGTPDLICQLLGNLLLTNTKDENENVSSQPSNSSNRIDMINRFLNVFLDSLSHNPFKNTQHLPSLMLNLYDLGAAYKTILIRMLSNEHFVALVKKEGQYLVNILSQRPLQQTESYKSIVSIAVAAFGDWMKDLTFEDTWNYTRALEFSKMIFKEAHYEDIARQFVSLEQFRVQSFEIMLTKKGKTLLERLINDLQKALPDNKFYAESVLVRVTNLKSLIEENDLSKFSWRQPQAKLGWPEVENFLRSEESTFVYKDYFESLEHAKVWIRQCAGSKRTYSFTATSRGSGRNTEVVLKKDKKFHEKVKKRYLELMSELKNLEDQLQTIPSLPSKVNVLKRPVLSAEGDAQLPKKALMSHEN